MALGGIAGGVLASPLGPWGAVGGSTIGATVGVWLTSRIWLEFYTDLRRKMEQVKLLLEKEDFPAAVELITRIRNHPRYHEQERHFRSELEDALGRITLHLARKADADRDNERALDYYRKAFQIRPNEASILERIIRLKLEMSDVAYENSGNLESDLEDLLRLNPRSETAYRTLLDLYDRKGRAGKAMEILDRAEKAFSGEPAAQAAFLEIRYRRCDNDVDILIRLLDRYLQTGKTGAAMALIEEVEAAGKEPEDPMYLALKGRALYHRNDYDKAAGLLRDAIERRGTIPAANLNLASILISRGRYGEAASLLAPLMSIPSRLPEALVPFTECLIRCGKLDEAELNLQRPVFRELPEYAARLRQLARAYENKNMQDKARRIWNLLGEVSQGPPFWRRFAVVYRDDTPVLLGAGRMGRVYLGRSRENDGMVAIREIPFAGLHDALRIKRFKRDIELLSTLEHPNVVRLYGHALFEGKTLMALEYCAGGSLKDLEAKELLWSRVKRLALDILRGLEYLHSHDPPLVHRNLKPGNILVSSEGTAKISDFALARLLESPQTSVMTSVQEQAASYRYTAPEIILGSASTGPLADVYSFGCILYELLTGDPPFTFADTDVQIRAHLKNRPDKASSKAEWIPGDLDTLLLQMLEKKPAARPASVEHIIQRLEKI